MNRKDGYKDFNSIKVRLKRVFALFCFPDIVFQFHKGTIKTLLLCLISISKIISIP